MPEWPTFDSYREIGLYNITHLSPANHVHIIALHSHHTRNSSIYRWNWFSTIHLRNYFFLLLQNMQFSSPQMDLWRLRHPQQPIRPRNNSNIECQSWRHKFVFTIFQPHLSINFSARSTRVTLPHTFRTFFWLNLNAHTWIVMQSNELERKKTLIFKRQIFIYAICLTVLQAWHLFT